MHLGVVSIITLAPWRVRGFGESCNDSRQWEYDDNPGEYQDRIVYSSKDRNERVVEAMNLSHDLESTLPRQEGLPRGVPPSHC